MGTGETGSGTRARHFWSASTGTATTTGAMAGNARACDNTYVGFATEDCVRVEVAAQQLSACAWLIVRFEAGSCGFDLCIGQVVPFMQHAIRASGLDCQPAQTAALPAQSVSIATRADRRLTKPTTYLECWTRSMVSNRVASQSTRGTGPTGILTEMRAPY